MGNPIVVSFLSLHLISLVITSLVLFFSFNGNAATVDRNLMAAETHDFHIITVSSMLPDSVCGSSSEDMSNRSGSRKMPPFLAKGGSGATIKPSINPSIKSPPSAPQPKDLHAELEAAAKASDAPPSKRHKKDGSLLPTPKPPATATPVHHLFAKHGFQHASETECTNWVGADLIENADSVTKGLAQAFIRQASHQKELKDVVASNAKLEQEVKVLRFKLEEDKRSLMETHRLALQSETASLASRLKLVTSEKVARERALKEAEKFSEDLKEKHETDLADLKGRHEAELAKLQKGNEVELAQMKKELEAAQADHEAVVEAAQVEFMKGFIRKIPDFDWDRLGPGNAEFAESLRKEMEDEAAKKGDAT